MEGVDYGWLELGGGRGGVELGNVGIVIGWEVGGRWVQ